MHHGFHECLAGCLGLGELGFEVIAEGHELIDFGHDAVLFGEWGDWNSRLGNFTYV